MPVAAFQSVRSIEEFGRIRLSPSFFMRDFLHSEISQFTGIPNLPTDPDLAVYTGRMLCQTLLEPLQELFGRIAIRSAYRSAQINDIGSRKGYGCARNERNFARHIWDVRDADGACGATACIVIPWFADRYARGEDWRALAWWLHDHLPYSELTFYRRLCAFNIAWHERPKKVIRSLIAPTGVLRPSGTPSIEASHEDWYRHWGDKFLQPVANRCNHDGAAFRHAQFF
ncbi:hypothetical protein O5O51_03320 [Sinirhodobacter sp. HNIBRBA609]|nr:hypothetical protein O5O51_03320 [Sinirhodobacter sp. HNIBRBA609]